MNMQVFVISKFFLLNTCVLLHIRSVCAVQAPSFHITLVLVEYWTRIGFQTSYDVTNHDSKPTP